MKGVVLFSGLGNQMFQYAFYRGLATKYNDVFVITNQTFGKNQHNGEEVCKIFNLNPPQNKWFYTRNIACRIWRKILLKLGFLRIYDYNDNFNNINNVPFEVYIGYFMDLKYFDFVRDELIKEFVPREKLDSKNQLLLSKIKSHPSLGIHIRRGDFLSFQGGIALGLEYYKRALKHIKSKVNTQLNIFIFSDDLDFIKNNFIALLKDVWGGGSQDSIEISTTYLTDSTNNISNKIQIHIIDFNRGASSYKDLVLMQNTHYLITANSSFSWWAAYLNTRAKIIIIPENYLGKIGKNIDAFVPKKWIRV
ncbi:hypothetical protein CCY99_04750 [Helicobacter sp. 16-1353]|uniref:alpha-1,2-fucosyltransferase n=1 Tax=Helicobacter sp. 16-1353 TaxID=2004996 RepID=UPI000DCB917D|nr:alpha-1,2-fucosyltransferase [Helicobacter sp. 16-1353]RAX53995.1 hypothetical protein CCY99_04750 [Helicobacter sp. 16-1353]